MLHFYVVASPLFLSVIQSFHILNAISLTLLKHNSCHNRIIMFLSYLCIRQIMLLEAPSPGALASFADIIMNISYKIFITIFFSHCMQPLCLIPYILQLSALLPHEITLLSSPLSTLISSSTLHFLSPYILLFFWSCFTEISYS